MVSNKVVMQFVKLTANAFTPTRKTAQAAGYDLYSAYACTVPAGGKEVVKTDIKIALPDGCYGRIAPRSSLAVDHFVDVGAGVVDRDYRGDVKVVLFNFGKEDYRVERGDRIAQLIVEKICMPDLVEVSELDETGRGEGGFGSTGTAS